jgi:diadenylate cyclase
MPGLEEMRAFLTNETSWAIVQILAIAFVLYFVLKFLQGTRGAGVLRGLVIIMVGAYIAAYFAPDQLSQIAHLMQRFMAYALVAVVIVFQPELRRGLTRLGQNPFIRRFMSGESTALNQLAEAVKALSENKIGALIAVERDVGLRSYMEAGVVLDAEVSEPLLQTIFWPGTPLHDMGIIIQGERVAAAGCLFPVTERPGFSATLGTRHRAGVGITEETDAVAIVVSEETGQIALAFEGRLWRNISPDALYRELVKLLVREPTAAERKAGRQRP